MLALNLLSLPAAIALLAKIGLLACVRFSTARSREAGVLVGLMYALAAQNVAEIAAFHYSGPVTPPIPLTAGFAYFASSIVAVALLVHLVVVMLRAPERVSAEHRPAASLPVWVLANYAVAALLVCLLVFTPWLVAGFAPSGFTFTRIPGPLYPLFTLFVASGLLVTLGLLVLAAKAPETGTRRRKARLMLAGTLPMVVFAVAVVTMQALGVYLVSTPVFFALTVTFFVFVTAFAVFDTRLFGLSMPVAWLSGGWRATSFHRSMQALVADIDSLPSAQDALARLAVLTGAPLAVIGEKARTGGDFATAGAGPLANVDPDRLRGIDAVAVASDARRCHPSLATHLKSQGIAAVVPFTRRGAEGERRWLLFGATSSAAELDFDLVEDVCQRIGEHFHGASVDGGVDRRRVTSDKDVLDRLDTIATRLGALEGVVNSMADRSVELESDSALPQVIRRAPPEDAGREFLNEAFASIEDGENLAGLLSEIEARLLREALTRTSGNKAKAARLLGLRANTLHYKLSRHEIANDRSPATH